MMSFLQEKSQKIPPLTDGHTSPTQHMQCTSSYAEQLLSRQPFGVQALGRALLQQGIYMLRL